MKNIAPILLWLAAFSTPAAALTIHCEESPKQDFYNSLVKVEVDEYEGIFGIEISAPIQIENEKYNNPTFYKENGDSSLVLLISAKPFEDKVKMWVQATKDELGDSYIRISYGEKGCGISVIVDLEHNTALKSDAAKGGAP